MGKDAPAQVMPEIIGDNPATPDQCPICGAEPIHSSIHSVEYACGGTLAPLPGRLPTVWGGIHPPVNGQQKSAAAALNKLNENPPAEPGPNTLKIPLAQQIDNGENWMINPGPHQESLNLMLRDQIHMAFNKVNTLLVTGGNPDPVEIVANDVERMLRTGNVS